jgi:hypothetical protein
MRGGAISSVLRQIFFSDFHALAFLAEGADFFRPITAPTTAPATDPAAEATPLATADAPLAIAAGAAAMPVALPLFGFGAAFAADAVLAAGFADADDLLAAFAGLAAVFGAGAFAAAAFGLSVALAFCAALFAGAFASLERAAMAGPAPVFASSAFDFPAFAACAGFFISVPRVSVASSRNANPPRKFPTHPIGAQNGRNCGETAGISG